MKSILLTAFFTYLILFSPQIVFAQDEDKIVTITSSGSGNTQDEAKLSACRSAIEQAFGAFISSKTEIFNDQVVADQMASVSSGNIKSYEVLNESQLPDGSWGVTLKAIVSVDKLTTFVQAKGIAIEIKGGLFALNIKQQLLNEEGEFKAICEMVGLLHEPMQTSFDYVISSSTPVTTDAESKNWEIPLVVTATANKNMDFCANYFIKTLAAISLSDEEVATYKSLNKIVYTVEVSYNGVLKKYYLRKTVSLIALTTFAERWEFYIKLFNVNTGLDDFDGFAKHHYGAAGINIHGFFSGNKGGINISFLTSGQQAAYFSLKDERSLTQIEQMTGYTVKPRGVVSQFKHGGIVVYEENGHGLVAAIMDVGFDRDEGSYSGIIQDFAQYNYDRPYASFNFEISKKLCDDLVLNGYNDWRLPTKSELMRFPISNGIALRYNFHNKYWTSTTNLTGNMNGYFWHVNFHGKKLYTGASHFSDANFTRAVRAF